MLIEIQGEHTGSITMFGDVATRLLKMMGQSGQSEGAIRAEDVGEALGSLETALARLEEPESEDEDGNARVSLQTRAKPLLDLLRSSQQQQGYVMWKPK